MSATSAEEIRASSYVGFDSITSQIEHKLLKRGFQFNVIVVGALYWWSCVSLSALNSGVLAYVIQDRRVWASRRSSTPYSRPT